MHHQKSFLFVICFHSCIAVADDGFDIAVGVGAQFNGAGANISTKSESSRKYFAVGCPSISVGDDWESKCGAGVGWLQLGTDTGFGLNHSFGIHLGTAFDTSDVSRFSTEYFLAPQYVYYLDENQKGWNFGLSPAVSYQYNEADLKLLINFGYQF